MAAGCAVPTRRIQIDGVTAKNVIALLDRCGVLFRRVSVDDSFHSFVSTLWAMRRSEGLANAEPIVQAQVVRFLCLFRFDLHYELRPLVRGVFRAAGGQLLVALLFSRLKIGILPISWFDKNVSAFSSSSIKNAA